MTKTAWMDGEIKDNRTSVTLVNNTAKEQIVTVPTGVRWILFGGSMKNGDSVGRNCNVMIRDESGNQIFQALRVAAVAAGGHQDFPTGTANDGQLAAGSYPIPVPAGYQIRFYFAAGGASAGGTGYVHAYVLELPE